jgi:ribosomal protein S18 acetylase RimI-like enzyme
VLELSAGLSPRARDALADLERRAVAADGGRLKLEWGVLNRRPSERVQDVLWWESDRLLGFLGLYDFSAPTVELAGVVDPDARRQGIGTALLDAAGPLIREGGYERALLIVPRNVSAGAAFARSRGGELDHSEHALVLAGDPADGPVDPAITVRDLAPGDAEVVLRLLRSAFDWVPRDPAALLAADGARTVLIERAGEPVGTARLSLDSDGGAIYGFAVDPALQGRGIGRQALREFCRLLRSEGAARVALEVAVENERALGLYTSVGFEPVTTEDYYALPIAAPSAGGSDRAKSVAPPA